MAEPLLVELLTEELPPKVLRRLSEAFGERIAEALVRQGFADPAPRIEVFATPRRLAVRVAGVRERAPDSTQEIEGPLAANRKAVEGFAKKHGLAVEALGRREAARGEIVLARYTLPGARLEEAIGAIVEAATRRLPAPKTMRWGAGEVEFVRPVHGLLLLHGARVLRARALGLEACGRTRGHRFLGRREIALAHADEYERRLLEEGRVLASMDARKREIEVQLEAEAARAGAQLGDCAALVEEVAALVEYPTVYAGSFDPAFLAVPQECLILTMRQNQKYFPLFDAAGRLLPRFLVVSNMRAADPGKIVAGNERVVRPRLEDARFFYEQDRRRRLEERVPALAQVVYHRRLGSQLERVERLQRLAGRIARELGADPALAGRAAWLAKADLLTGMVVEFPELQGVIGRHYALADGERAEVADAIEQHYWPRFAGDRLPAGPVGCALALADRLDALAGLFSIGEKPTGEKDPFGLRRAALGVVRILVEKALGLRLPELVDAALEPFAERPREALLDFVYERFAGYLREQGHGAAEIEAVLGRRPAELAAVPRVLEALAAFRALPEAESLAAANKRVASILRQAAARGERFGATDRAQLRERAEIALYEALAEASGRAGGLLACGDFAGYLRAFAALKRPVDAFFEEVKVMAEEAELRRNRLALLAELREAMNRVADLSRLAA